MNSVAQPSPTVITLAMFSGLITFLLALAISFLAIYTLLHTGQSILGQFAFTQFGWLMP